jgi:hypothetical protein
MQMSKHETFTTRTLVASFLSPSSSSSLLLLSSSSLLLVSSPLLLLSSSLLLSADASPAKKIKIIKKQTDLHQIGTVRRTVVVDANISVEPIRTVLRP